MTKDFDVQKVAVIGGGFTGLSTLADLLYTSADGTSTIKSGVKPTNPAFKSVTLFERNDQIGGVWNYSTQTDADFPDGEILKTKQYWEPSVLLAEKKSEDHDIKTEYSWDKSAAYENLYTNISYDFMTLSTLEKKEYPERAITPFLTHKEVLRIILDFAEKYKLHDNISLSSSVQTVEKDEHGKYTLTIRKKDPNTGEYNWYTEKFDAIVAASGRSIPHIPRIKNLGEFAIKNKDVVVHTKSFRRGDVYRGKKVLIIGSSVSSIGVLEYLKPVASEIHLSIRSFRDDNHTVEKYYNKAFGADDITQHGEIVEFDLENNQVVFKDGETVGGFDKIIFATGYHIHYPYLEQLDQVAKVDKANGEQRGNVSNLFHFVFTIGEPTIAYVGISSSPFFILLSEAQGSAIAGVWSNTKKLPDIETQRQWVSQKLLEGAERRITNFFREEESEVEIEYLNNELGTIGRPSPGLRADPVLWNKQRETLSVIYEKFASGELNEDYISQIDTSGL